jgi:hypothetical protein
VQLCRLWLLIPYLHVKYGSSPCLRPRPLPLPLAPPGCFLGWCCTSALSRRASMGVACKWASFVAVEVRTGTLAGSSMDDGIPTRKSRTRQTARKSTGGKAPRLQLAYGEPRPLPLTWCLMGKGTPSPTHKHSGTDTLTDQRDTLPAPPPSLQACLTNTPSCPAYEIPRGQVCCPHAPRRPSPWRRR